MTAFSTTRSGGVSTGSFSSLNINAYCGDSPEHIAANREALAQELDILPSRLIVPHQVHGVESRRIGPHYFTLPLSARQNLIEGVDAVMTDVCQVAVGVYYQFISCHLNIFFYHGLETNESHSQRIGTIL